MPSASNRTVQALWIGPSLSVLERLCIRSFLAHGHDFHLYTYGNVDGIPAGTKVLDGRVILPEESIFKYRDHDSYSGFSNLFRYKLLLERGGIWVDTDVVCLRPLDLARPLVIASEAINPDSLEFQTGKRRKTATCLMKAPAGSPFMHRCLEESMRYDAETLTWGMIGPDLTQRLVQELGAEDLVAPTAAFCPVHYWNVKRLVASSRRHNWELRGRLWLKRSFGVHFWNEMWRRNNLHKNATYPQSCLYETLKRRYL